AFELARAMLAGPWRVDAVAEAAGGHLLQWPSWLEPLALHVTSVYRRAPVSGSGALVRVIDTFLAERDAGPEPPAPAPTRSSSPTDSSPGWPMSARWSGRSPPSGCATTGTRRCRAAAACRG